MEIYTICSKAGDPVFSCDPERSGLPELFYSKEEVDSALSSLHASLPRSLEWEVVPVTKATACDKCQKPLQEGEVVYASYNERVKSIVCQNCSKVGEKQIVVTK